MLYTGNTLTNIDCIVLMVIIFGVCFLTGTVLDRRGNGKDKE
jgi:hypothetical protein